MKFKDRRFIIWADKKGKVASQITTINMSEIWVQCFTCCWTEQPQPKRRRRIDRSMIGEPTNFRHTGHIGSGDMHTGGGSNLTAIQNQMRSKGGYEYAVPVSMQIAVGGLQK